MSEPAPSEEEVKEAYAGKCRGGTECTVYGECSCDHLYRKILARHAKVLEARLAEADLRASNWEDLSHNQGELKLTAESKIVELEASLAAMMKERGEDLSPCPQCAGTGRWYKTEEQKDAENMIPPYFCTIHGLTGHTAESPMCEKMTRDDLIDKAGCAGSGPNPEKSSNDSLPI